ncbi:MAG: flavin reductase family protein [Oligoflexia bacterium]|nr:flavin reductase family protein [Oligoflexia bacterium]
MKLPNPHWKIGTKIDSPVNEMVDIDPKSMRTGDLYRLMIGSIVPRPIALVSTASKSGKFNLAPFSFFNGVSSKPPCLIFSVSRKPDGTKKDTQINIEETGQFVVNSSNLWMAEAVVHCGTAYPYGVSEFEEIGLTAIPSDSVQPPRVKESAVQMECELYNCIAIGNGGPGSAALMIGEIVKLHIHKPAYQDGKIVLEEYKPFGRIGGVSYTGVERLFDLPVPEA